MILLKETPFYAEKGGQVADIGTISAEKGLFTVTDCQSPYSGVIAHKGKVSEGLFRVGDVVTASIDEPRRLLIAAHHTATHLLHWALQQILGEHIRQAGSLVEPNRLRFDFNHHKGLSDEELKQIEDLVNEKIRENQSVSTYEISYDEAQGRDDIKQFFGEKYGSHVRVVDIHFSKELCGGTHAYHVGMLGYFRITKESSIASGVRRIEASCGKAAEEFVRQEEEILENAAALLKAKPANLEQRIRQLLDEQLQMKAEMKMLKKGQLKTLSDELAAQAKEGLLSAIVDVDGEDLGDLADGVMQKMQSGVVVLALTLDGRVQVAIRVSPDYIEKGIQAGALIKEISPKIGGGGGGKPGSAQAGGKNPAGIDEAFALIKNRVKS
jgi:alanyl-tRNA synthetase